MSHSTRVIAEAGKQELFIIREFDAPRELVYRAFSDPEILVQFFAPHDTVMTFDYADYQTDGRYRYTHTRPEGVVLCTFKGVIHEMAAPERIVQTAELEGLPEAGQAILEVMTFEALPGNRCKLTIHDICRSVATRDAMIKSGMESGLVIIFNQLDLFLQKQLV